jgi:hypothetical protein
MKIKQILILLTLSFASFGQNKFIGEFKNIFELADTALINPTENVYNKNFVIRSDFTYTYSEEENPKAFEKPQKESIDGSWKSNGDTITFYNKNYKIPKDYKYNYYPNQKFNGVKLIIRNATLKRVDFAWCSLDSFDVANNFEYLYRPFRKKLKDEVIVSDTLYTLIRFAPHGYCKKFSGCEFYVDLFGIKSGTLIELIFYSKQIELLFNNKKYILTNNILQEISSDRNVPEEYKHNFMRKK